MRSDFSSPILVQFFPPSAVLYIPSPMETLFRVHTSPVPTQTVLSGSDGSTVTTPIDWQYLSKIEVKFTPPSIDFHTPPPAEPRYTICEFVGCISTSETRPLISAGPMWRALRSPKNSDAIKGFSFCPCTPKAIATPKQTIICLTIIRKN